MKNEPVKIRIQRIQRMEALMERVCSVLDSQKPDINLIHNDLRILENYYATDWIDDYQADENGELPSNLKRGILDQDSLYDLLQEADQIQKQNI